MYYVHMYYGTDDVIDGNNAAFAILYMYIYIPTLSYTIQYGVQNASSSYFLHNNNNLVM